MTKLILGLAAAAALALTLPVLAQDAAKPAVAIPKDTFFVGQAKGQHLARQWLIGQKVLNKEGQSIGEVLDLIVDDEHKVDGVIVRMPGQLGAAEKNIGVQIKALKIETKDGKAIVSLPAATKEVLAAVGAYKRTAAPKDAKK